MIAKWPKLKLADCVELLPGFAFKSQHFTNRLEDIALIKGENVSQGCILWDISKRWPGSDWPKMEKFQLRPGDVVLAMDRPWIPAGLKWAFIREGDPKALLVQRCARLRSNNGRLDQGFLRFVIGSPSFENYVKPITTGVNVPHISGQQILDFEFPLPPLSVQRWGAAILSAYDDLIENYQRRIRILEEMARSLYREWFVNFRFPGREKVKVVATNLGDIPKGWEVKKIGEITAFLSRGISPTYDENGDSIVLNQKCIRDQRLTLEQARRQKKQIPSEKRVRFGDVLINSTGVGTLGRVAQVYQELGDCTVDTHVTIARPIADVNVDFFGCTLLSQQDTFDRLGFGSTNQTELSRTSISNVELLLPPLAIQQLFGDLVGPMRSAATTLTLQILNLRRMRDLLLPRLVHGELDSIDKLASMQQSLSP